MDKGEGKILLDNLMEIMSDLDPISFYDSDSNLKNKLEKTTKNLYKLIKKELPKSSGPLDKLITKNLSIDQIWEEINLANNPVMKILSKNVNKNLKSINQIDFPTILSKEEEEKYVNEKNSEEDIFSNEEINENEIDDEMDEKELNDDYGGELNEDGDVNKEDFFTQDGMEKFVNQAENQMDGDQELNEMLYGKDMGDDNMEDYNYKDFFDEKDESSGEDEFKGMKETLEGKYKDMPFHTLTDNDNNEEDEDEEDAKEDNKKLKNIIAESKKGDEEDSEEMSKLDPLYHKRKSLQEQIKLLEEENLANKEWALQGEVNSKARPLDSLIEKNIEFDVATRPVPIITEEFTTNLEEIIKKRIIEEAWDDVIRKEVVNVPYKPVIELEKEKSDKGLAEIYEQQYKDKYQKATGKTATLIDEVDDTVTEKLDKNKQEIANDWDKLLYKLDVISNLNFAPRPPTKLVISGKDKKNKAVTKLDEATPSNVSESSLIAPQEFLPVENKPLKGASELTKEEKKKKRKHKKEKFKKTKVEIEKKYGKKEKDIEKEIISERNTSKANKDDKTRYTKSSQFFSKIQNDKQKEDDDKNSKKKKKRSKVDNSK